MEAVKNTALMLVFAVVFYGAYQMFVSNPGNQTADSSSQQAQVILGAGEAAAYPATPPANGPPANGQPANGQPANGQPTGQMPMGQSPMGQALANPNSNYSNQTAPQNPSFPATNPAVGNQGFASLPANPQSQARQNAVAFPSVPNPAGQGGLDNTISNVQPLGTQMPDPRGVGTLQYNQNGNEPARTVGFDQPNGFATDGSRSLGNGGLGNNGSGNLLGQPAPSPFDQAMETAMAEARSGRSASALQRLTPWLNQPLAAQQHAQLMAKLDELAVDVIYSTKHTLANPYTIAEGDTLGTAAAKLQMSPQLLAQINFYGQNLTAATPLQPGAELKVIPGRFQAIVNLSQRHLTLYLGDLYAGRFRFQTGESVPRSDYQNRVVYASVEGIPARGENGQVIQPMAAGNPFGRYCLVVGDQVVIHSPGQDPSASCLELTETDMKSLMALLDKGCDVQIQTQ